MFLSDSKEVTLSPVQFLAEGLFLTVKGHYLRTLHKNLAYYNI